MTAPARQPANPPARLVYSVEEAADVLGIGRTFMFHLIATGEIASFKIGKRRKIPRDEIDAYIKRLRAEQAASPGSGQFRGPEREADRPTQQFGAQ